MNITKNTSVFLLILSLFLGSVMYYFTPNLNNNVKVEASNTEETHISENLSPMLWSDSATWPGNIIPDETTPVIIEKNQRVVIDTNAYAQNIIVRGTLEVQDSGDLELTTGWLLVDGGVFKVGSVESPFQNKFTLTIDNLDDGADVNCGGNHYRFSNHFIAAFGGGTMHNAQNNSYCNSVGDSDAVGKISVHVADTKTEWTKLNQTAPVGATSIELNDVTGWEVGDTIILAPTDYDFRQAEERVITGISANTVSFDTPLEYMHFGEFTYGVDQRGEVANLTRNVEFTTEDSVKNVRSSGINHFSGATENLRLFRLHIFIAHSGKAYIDGVSITDGGKEGQLGKYPVHWHHTGDITGQYIKNSVVRDSINRCISLHISHNGLIHNNVTYNNVGHCFYLEHDEDNINRPENNTISSNLAIKTIRPSALQKVKDYDESISSFWITHPNNIIIDNVAAGTGNLGDGYSARADLGAGFWYHLLNVPFPAVAIPQFDRNTSHSNVSSGFWIDGDEGDWYDTNQDMYINEYTGYKNRVSNFWIRSVSPEFQKKIYINDSYFSDSLNGVYIASGGKLFYGFGVVNNSVFVGESENMGTVNPGFDEIVGLDGRTVPVNRIGIENRGGNTIRGVEIYDGYTEYNNNTFINFESNSQRSAAAFALPYNTPYMQHPGTSTSGNTLINTNPVYLDPVFEEAGAQTFVLLDKDGSLTGENNSYVVGKNNLMWDETCDFVTEWQAYYCTDTHLAMLRIENEEIDIHFVDAFNFQSVADGQTDSAYRVGPDFKKNNPEYFSNFQTNHWYDFVDYDSLTNENFINNVYDLDFELAHSNTIDRWLGLSYPYPYYPESIEAVDGSGSNLVELYSMEAIEASQDSAYFYDFDSQKLYLKLWVRDTDADLNERFWGTQNEIQVRMKPTLRNGESLSVNGRSVYPDSVIDKDEIKEVCDFNSVSHGSAIIDPQNPSAFIYTAPNDYTGIVTVDYESCNEAGDLIDPSTVEEIRVIADNVRPDISDTTEEFAKNSENNTVNLSINDADNNFDVNSASTIEIVQDSINGDVTVTGTDISYTPDSDFVGTDTIIVKVCDDENECDLGTVELTILEITEVQLSGSLSENSYNDGSVDGVITLSSINNTWADENSINNNFQISGLPSGLSYELNKINSVGVELTLTGNADNHSISDSTSIGIQIEPGAFETQNVGNDSTITIDDIDITFIDDTSAVDSDNDGVSDEDEQNSPNQGDANNDGIQDSSQPNVSSQKSPDNNFVTLVSGGGECSEIDEFSQISESSLSTSSEDVDYPEGLSDFTLNCTGVGDTAEIELYYYVDEDYTDIQFYKFIDSEHKNITSEVVISELVIDGQDIIKVEYGIIDGGDLDTDGQVNGVIVDPAGIALDTQQDGGIGNLLRTGGMDALMNKNIIHFHIVFAVVFVLHLSNIMKKKSLN